MSKPNKPRVKLVEPERCNVEQALTIFRCTVGQAWVDFNGHMGDFAYGIVFSDAGTAYMERIGIGAGYREATSATLYTLDSRIGFLHECHLGTALTVRLLVLAADAKRIHILLQMVNEAGDELALCEQLLIHVSRAEGSPRSAPMPQTILDRVMADRDAHAYLARPKWLDRRIGLRPTA